MLTSEEQLSIQFYDSVRHSLKLKAQLKKHMGTKLCHVCTGRYPHHLRSRTYCAGYWKGEAGEGDNGNNSHGHHSPQVLPDKHDIDSTEAFFTACEKLHVINTPTSGNLETVPPWHGITSMFSSGTGLSDQERHNITVTTSLLSASSPYQLLPFNRNGSPLEGKELRMVALKEVRGKR